jgi:hypothetical protein
MANPDRRALVRETAFNLALLNKRRRRFKGLRVRGCSISISLIKENTDRYRCKKINHKLHLSTRIKVVKKKKENRTERWIYADILWIFDRCR